MTKLRDEDGDTTSVCDACQQRISGPMLHDHVWEQIADDVRGDLCICCMDERALQRLGREVRSTDLKDCMWNVGFFDLLASEGK